MDTQLSCEAVPHSLWSVLQRSHLTIMNIQNCSETKFFIYRTQLLGSLPDCIMWTALKDNSFLYVQEWIQLSAMSAMLCWQEMFYELTAQVCSMVKYGQQKVKEDGEDWFTGSLLLLGMRQAFFCCNFLLLIFPT